MSALKGWAAMRVVRKHTLPYHRAENLAEHTWGVVHLLLCVYPNASVHLIKAAMYHDSGEYRCGDIPGDFKAAYPEVGEIADEYEADAARAVLPEHLHDALTVTSTDRLILKICDRIEFAFSCHHEWKLGNRYAGDPLRRTIDMASALVQNNQADFTALPESLQESLLGLIQEATRLHAEVVRFEQVMENEVNYAS